MKLMQWCMMLTAMMMFLTIVGVTTSFNSVLELVGVESISGNSGVILAGDVQDSDLWDNLFGTTGLFIVTLISSAVAIGLFVLSKEIGILLVPFIVFVGQTFIGTFWSVIIKVNSYGQWWMTSITSIIFVTLSIGFVIALVNYFGGRQ